MGWPLNVKIVKPDPPTLTLDWKCSAIVCYPSGGGCFFYGSHRLARKVECEVDVDVVQGECWAVAEGCEHPRRFERRERADRSGEAHKLARLLEGVEHGGDCRAHDHWRVAVCDDLADD